MCSYQGYEFGAGTYPDSACNDGKLWDADSDGMPDEDIPCPICRRDDAIEWWSDGSMSIEDATNLVDDIRSRRNPDGSKPSQQRTRQPIRLQQ
jgi:hypothetical protein